MGYTAVLQTNKMYAKWRQFLVITGRTIAKTMEEINRQTSNKTFHQGYVWKGKAKLGKKPEYVLLPKYPYKVSYTMNDSEWYKWDICSESPPMLVNRKRRGKFDEEDATILLHDFADAYTFHLNHSPDGELGEAIKIMKI